MNKYVLKATNRPPVSFTGVFLGSSTNNADVDQAVVNDDHDSLMNYIKSTELYKANCPHGKYLSLSAYETKSKKIVLVESRFEWDFSALNDSIMGRTAKLDVYENVEHLLNDQVKKDGSYGFHTVKLMNSIVDSSPDYSDLWIEEID
jgi:hypothetical protein